MKNFFETYPKTKKVILGLFAIFVFPVWGNFLWDFVGKKVVNQFFHFSLNTLSYFHGSIRDSIYREIAVGFFEEPSLRVHQLLLMLCLVLTIAYFGSLRIRMQRLYDGVAEQKQKILSRISPPEHLGNEVEIDLNSIKDRISLMESSLDKSKMMFNFACGLTLILALSLIFPVYILNYKNKIIANYNQNLAIVSPYLKPNEKEIYESRFASIDNKDDYVELIASLESKAMANKVKFINAWVW